MSPPASHSIATYFQTLVSLPSAGHSRPNTLFAGIGERLGVGAEVVPRPVGGGLGEAGLREQVLVVDDREVVDERRHAEHLAVDGRDRALAGEKSFQL